MNQYLPLGQFPMNLSPGNNELTQGKQSALRPVLLIGLLAMVAACGGGGSDPAPTAPVTGNVPGTTNPPATSTVLSGKVSFERVPHDSSTNGLQYLGIYDQPVRGAVVELVNRSGTTLASTVTDERGDYSFTTDANQEVSVRVKAQMQKTGAPSWDIRVVDNTAQGALYTLTSGAFTTSGANMTRNLEATSGWTGSGYTELRAAGPFAILDSVYDSVQMVLDARPSIQMPSLDMNWSVDNRPTSGSFTDGEIGSSLFRPAGGGREIYILGAENSDTDEYDAHVIAHEFTHYLHYHFGRSDSLGGSHSVGDRLDPRVALGEGLASAFAAMFLDDSNYIDALGFDQASGVNIDIENNNIRNLGWYNEGTVQILLYDLYDASSDAGESLELGFKAVYDAMAGDLKDDVAFVTIHAFLDAMKKNHPADASAIDQAAASQEMVTIDAYGTGETNSAARFDKVLPIYTELPLDGSVVRVCTFAGFQGFGTGNKLGNRRFLRFSVTNPQPNSTTVITAVGPAASDPDMVLHQAGALQTAFSPQLGSDQISRNLAAGDYVLEVYEYTNTTDSPLGDACFDLSVSTS
ncbi:MAG: SdrD B-like domain-containing protein [Gammaproteobacteria bacterium]